MLAAALALLAGCGGGEAGQGPAGVVNTAGSTSMELAVGALIETFCAQRQNVSINYSGTGSSAGIQSAAEGTCDIGLSSRELKKEELERGVQAYVIALEGVAVIVHPSNPVEKLKAEQLVRLARGEISNWSQLGGGEAPVAFIGREAGSGTRSAFEEGIGFSGKCAYTNELTSTGDVIANVSTNPNAIGYVSLAALNGGVKCVEIDGITPGISTVQDGSYPIQRPFLMVVRRGEALSEPAAAFLDYALSAEAGEMILAAGAVPPPAEGGTADRKNYNANAEGNDWK